MTGQAQLAGKTAVVTGAGSGIGLATAIAFVAAGARTILVDRNEEELRAVVDAYAPGSLCCAVDIRDRQALSGLGDMLQKAVGRLDIVVANAGVNVRAEALDQTEGDVTTIIETNLAGSFATLQLLAPLVLEKTGGRFIVTSSIAATLGMARRAVYGATKGGLDSLVRALAVEWGPFGATVNAVAPGILATPLTQLYLETHPERAASAVEHTPLGRLGTPEDVAKAIRFLASDDAAFITGTTITVDGGVSAGIAWW